MRAPVKCRVVAGIASFVAALAGGVARAEDASDSTEEVTVRGTQAGGFSSRAREGDTSREVTDAASLVEPLPGVHVRRLGADDSFSTLSIRGSTSSEVAVVLAGVPLSGGADPSLDLATLPLWPGSEARVYRSFSPAVLGPGSLGGTLEVDPPRAGAPTATDVWAAAGSFGARRLRLGDVRDAGGGSRVVTALSASRSDDDFGYLDPRSGAFIPRVNAGHADVNGLVAWALPVRWTAESTGALTVTTLAQARHQDLPGSIYAPTPFQSLDSDRELASVELTGPAGEGAWNAHAWGRREELTLRDSPSFAARDLSPAYAASGILAAGGAGGWRGRVAREVILEARIDTSSERFAPGETLGGALPPGATRASVGGGLDAEWRPTSAWTLTATGRLDGRSDTSAGTTAGDVLPTGHLGTEVALGALSLVTHAGAVVRPPSFLELYGDRGAFIGDSTLRPESAWTWDFGARLAERLGALSLAMELDGFVTWADDLIVFVYEGAEGRSKATNIGRARLAGAEAEARARISVFEVRASYTGLATANESACAFVSDVCDRPSLPGRPSNDLVGDALVHLGPLRLRYGVDVVTGMNADLTGTIEVPARVLQSAGARLAVPGVPGLWIAADLRNLFDVRTATYQGALGPVREPIGDAYEYPLPGRSVLVSVRYVTAR
jgi:TonB dependent receptor-like, beta-barrel/TonB-dependent Receptor Plug Domain